MDKATKQVEVRKMTVISMCKSGECERKEMHLTLGGLTPIGLR